MLKILFAARPAAWSDYETPLTSAFENAGIDADLSCDHAPETVDYIVYAPNGPLRDFTPFTRTKAVLNLWAGVEQVIDNPTLTQSLTRMVDPALTEGMVEWVCGHVMRHHLDIDHFLAHQSGDWIPKVPPLARDRRVTVLGLGALGAAAAQMLAKLGFAVTGWSRSPRTVDGITCAAGSEGLASALSGAEIVVLLLPQTPETENVIDVSALARMARGAVIVNPGRGPLIDDAALLVALNTGQIRHATLDVFRTEPLPADHPFWAHPNVTVTPHIASETRPASASEVIAENIRRCEAGEEMLFQVDRTRGY